MQKSGSRPTVDISSHSGIYTLRAVQDLPLDIESAWEFFSNPSNLAKITPPDMGFNTTSVPAAQTYAGQIISYKVSVLPGIRLNWVTEITHVSEGRYFVDEQRFGPYAMWHHEHFFEPMASGTRMTDIVSYKVPFGFIGRLFHGILVRPRLMKIFGFRFTKLNEVFNRDVRELVA